jgi:type I restriction-modification system DNA methylase subunit
MLSVAGEYLAEHNPQARLTMFGQELNAESYAICKADMLIKGQDVANIVFGNTFSEDGHPHKTFDYMLSNPPFGVEWKKVEKEVRKEHETQGFNGRFGPGFPIPPRESTGGVGEHCAEMLDRVVGLFSFGAGEVNNMLARFRTVLGDQAKGLAGFLGLRRMCLHSMKDLVEITDKIFRFRR